MLNSPTFLNHPYKGVVIDDGEYCLESILVLYVFLVLHCALEDYVKSIWNGSYV